MHQIGALLRNSFIIAALIILLAPHSYAGQDRGGKFLEKMTKEMDLTKEQQGQLKAIHAQSAGQMKTKRDAMKQAHKDLEDALRSDATNDEVRAKFIALKKYQDEFATARFEKILSVRSILTPEQRKKMKSHGYMGGFKRHHEDNEGE